VTKLRHANAENHSGSAETARQSAIAAICGIIGAEKSAQLLALARDRWNKGSEELEATAAKDTEPTMLKGPNAVPKDTRVVVNIPLSAGRFPERLAHQVLQSGHWLPGVSSAAGLRKAQLIIFNPT